MFPGEKLVGSMIERLISTAAGAVGIVLFGCGNGRVSMCKLENCSSPLKSNFTSLFADEFLVEINNILIFYCRTQMLFILL